MKVEIHNIKKLYSKWKAYDINAIKINHAQKMGKVYYINYDMINEILKRLLNDDQLQNVTYKEF